MPGARRTNYRRRAGGIKAGDLDYVAFYEKPFLKFDRILQSCVAYAPPGLRSFLMAIPLWIRERIWMKELIRTELGCKCKIIFPEHHESHAASAFFPSLYPEAAFLTVDGVGEWTTTSSETQRRSRCNTAGAHIGPHTARKVSKQAQLQNRDITCIFSHRPRSVPPELTSQFNVQHCRADR